MVGAVSFSRWRPRLPIYACAARSSFARTSSRTGSACPGQAAAGSSAASRASTGRVLFEGAAQGGAQAAGRAAGAIAPGLWADLVALDAQDVALAGLGGDTLLDSFVFAGDDRLVRDVWSAGRRVVSDGRHRARAAIVDRYRAVLARLRGRL